MAMEKVTPVGSATASWTKPNVWIAAGRWRERTKTNKAPHMVSRHGVVGYSPIVPAVGEQDDAGDGVLVMAAPEHVCGRAEALAEFRSLVPFLDTEFIKSQFL